MTFQPGATVYTQSFGSRPEDVEVPHIEGRPPTTTDNRYPVGKRWIDDIGNASYVLTSLSTSGNVTTAFWSANGGGSSEVSTLTADVGTAIPSGGNIQIAGTSAQISTSASGAVVTLSFPNEVIVPGSFSSVGAIVAENGITAIAGNISATNGSVFGATGLTTNGELVVGTTIDAIAGNITADNGNFVLGTSGNHLVTTSFATTTAAGANAFGTVTLVGGTATVATTSITANSVVVLSRQSVGATGANPLGQLTLGTVTAGTSFVINAVQQASSSALQTTDVSSIFWQIISHS